MKNISSKEITKAIKAVITEAQEYLIIVSPYVSFNEWEDLKQLLELAIHRKIQVVFYTRLENDNFKSWEQVEALGIRPKLIKNLHAKLYFNEKSGVVTSMNLLSSSSKNAIEFGLLLDKKEEIEELKLFCKHQLEPMVESKKPDEYDLYLAKETFINVLSNQLSIFFQKRVYVKPYYDELKFNINNEFYMHLEKTYNQLYIKGRISVIEFENFELFKTIFN
jgi:DNA repair photolyase